MFTNMHSIICYVIYFYSIGYIVNLVTAIGCVHIAESVGSRRELVANSYTPPTRRDKTVSSRRRRRCVLGFTSLRAIASLTENKPSVVGQCYKKYNYTFEKQNRIPYGNNYAIL